MNKLFNKIGKKLAEAADSIASYSVDRPLSVTTVASGQGQQAPADPCLEAQLKNIRSKLVRQLFYKHAASEYTDWSDVGVLVGSYNVNGKRPPPGLKLGDWLGTLRDRTPQASSNAETSSVADGGYPDIVVLGFQEIVPLSAGNVIVGSASTNIEAWDRAVAAELNGEAWAATRYGAVVTASDASAGPGPGPALNPVAEALDRQWSGAAPGPGAAHEAKTAASRIDALTGGPGNELQYHQVVSKQMVGLYLSIWVRKRLLPHVRGIQTAVVATGFGGYLGNKGAVAARLYVHDSPLCFVNAHLSSGDKDGDEAKRNANVLEILQRCDFAAAAMYDQSMNSSAAFMLASALGPGTWGNLKGIMDHANAIWMGDLNYRLSGVGDEDARRAIRSGQIAQLLEADQLRREMAAGRVFQGWREGAITFAPTFKFKVGSHTYLGDSASTAVLGADEDADDDYGEDGGANGAEAEAEKQKRRTPAWCDRILFTPVGALKQGAYVRGETTASDHKPVASRLELRAARYDRRKVDALLQACRRQADMQQAANRPRPSLEPNLITFDTVRYGEVKSYRVTLSNSGPVEGLFHFVPPPNTKSPYGEDDAPGLPAWVTAIPEEGYVPANGSCDIELRVCVDGGPWGAAAELAQSTEDFLDAIVILRVEDGSDLFLSLTGNYTRSSWLGLPLEAIPSEPSSPNTLPHTLRTLLSFLGSPTSLATEGILVSSVQQVLAAHAGEGAGESVGTMPEPSRTTQRALLQRLAPLITALEGGSDLPQDVTAHEAAAALLLFLGELPRPLLPAALVMLLDAELEAGQVPDLAAVVNRLLKDLLAPCELQLVHHVLELLQKVAASTATCVSNEQLADLMAAYLLPPLGPRPPPGAKERRQRALRVMLE